jgi:hypothetical protein
MGHGRLLKAKDVAELLQTTMQEQEKYGSNPIDELLKYVDEMQRRNEVFQCLFATVCLNYLVGGGGVALAQCKQGSI